MRWADALQALVDLRSDNLSAAIRWARIAQPRADMLMFTDKAAFAVFMRVLLATGQVEAALRCIRAQRALIAPFDHIKTEIELYLLDATALIAKGALDAARVALDSALAMAAPIGLPLGIMTTADRSSPILALVSYLLLIFFAISALILLGRGRFTPAVVLGLGTGSYACFSLSPAPNPLNVNYRTSFDDLLLILSSTICVMVLQEVASIQTLLPHRSQWQL
jgi:hypothetical protein